MIIIDFTHEHKQEAMNIALQNYEEERLQVPILPQIDTMPDLSSFADNGLGVAAFEGNQMIGFLCAYQPMQDSFGTTNVKGTFSPIHAHGQIGENRDRVYSKLYQAAAEKWVKEGIISHAVGLYAHDKEAANSFYYNGFGLRCIDAIRSMEEITWITNKTTVEISQITYSELPKQDIGKLLKLQNSLTSHLGTSPIFMNFPPITEEELFLRSKDDIRYYIAKHADKYIAYIKVGKDGENFITEDSSILNICGAYCVPEFRGTGVYQDLLFYMIKSLKKEGYLRLGVDCESFNPNARGFWLKHFKEYTHSVVRRIDEKAITG
jgi:GNAT superfamily N-acetyltransferase